MNPENTRCTCIVLRCFADSLHVGKFSGPRGNKLPELARHRRGEKIKICDDAPGVGKEPPEDAFSRRFEGWRPWVTHNSSLLWKAGVTFYFLRGRFSMGYVVVEFISDSGPLRIEADRKQLSFSSLVLRVFLWFGREHPRFARVRRQQKIRSNC